MFRRIYQICFPLSIRTQLGSARNRLKQWWWHHNIIKIVSWRYIRWRISTRSKHNDRQAKLRTLLASGKPINVAFEVTIVPKWKADSVLQLMLKHPRFKPIVWHLPYNFDKYSQQDCSNFQQCSKHFSALGAKLVRYDCLDAFPAEKKPDIVFPNEPYDISVFDIPQNKNLRDYLFCFVPYAFTSAASKKTWNHIIPNGALFNFAENEISARKTRSILDNGGINVVATGHPMADSFLFPEGERPNVWKKCSSGMKRVIWAPHWTVDAKTCWLYYGTILQTGQIMLELAKKYRGQLQFAFKPHPNLHDTLCRHPEWGKERTDAFYAKWREMPNTQFEDGAYTDLFMQSDAMIHDCGSFIQEYLFADKPCMYLKDPENSQVYSAMAEDCLNAYQLGITREEIEAFLQMVLQGEDPKAEVRRELRQKYLVPPNGKSAAQNIIDCLLNPNFMDTK